MIKMGVRKITISDDKKLHGGNDFGANDKKLYLGSSCPFGASATVDSREFSLCTSLDNDDQHVKEQ